MLTAYVAQVNGLLRNPGNLYASASITSWINQARLQVAAEGRCCHGQIAFTLPATVNTFSQSSLTPSAGNSGVLYARSILGIGFALTNRPSAYFQQFYASTAATGPPTVWTQISYGTNGVLGFWPVPVSNALLSAEVVQLPIPLVDDSTVETIPFPWTDAVQFLAAHLAFLNQTRLSDASNMWQEFIMFMKRSRDNATSDVLPRNQMASNVPSGTGNPLVVGQSGQLGQAGAGAAQGSA